MAETDVGEVVVYNVKGKDIPVCSDGVEDTAVLLPEPCWWIIAMEQNS